MAVDLSTAQKMSKATGTPVSWYLHSTPVTNSNGTTSYRNDYWNPATGSFTNSSSAKGGSSSLASQAAVQVPTSAALPSSVSDLTSYLQDIASSNNSWSAAQADKMMQFQQQSADKAMQFNHDEAELNRKWQEYMSDTAHQREIKDLQKAGLNPVLSVLGGNGAPVTSGATASGYASQGAMGETDMSANTSLVSLLGSMLAAQTSLTNSALSAKTQESVADKYTAMQHLVAQLQSDTQYGVAAIQRGTTLDAANISALANQMVAKIHAGATVSAAKMTSEATKISASIHAAAQRYGYDIGALTQKELAEFNADLSRELKSRDIEQELTLQYNSQQHEIYMKQYFPSSFAGYAGSLNANLQTALGSIGDLFFNATDFLNGLTRVK